MLAAPSPRKEIAVAEVIAEPPREAGRRDRAGDAGQSPLAARRASPRRRPRHPLPSLHACARATSPVAAAAPLFRARADLNKPASAPIPPVIPIVRPPDDPGIDDEAPIDEFVEQIGTPKAQAGGWRGFLARWGG